MNRWPLVLILLLLCACSDKPPIALGSLERDRIAHTATINEVVVDLPVPEGTVVTKGTVLLRLDDRQQQAMVEQAKANVARAEAHLEKLRNGARVEEVAAAQARVAAQKATLIESEQNYRRAKNLFAKQLDSQTNLDHTKASRDAAAANLRSAQEQLLALTNGTRDEDLRIAEAELRAAVAVVASEQKRLSDLTIVATRDGILDNLPGIWGERVTTGSPVAVILAGAAPYARVYVPEPYRVKIHTGTQLTVHIDGIDQPIVGVVRQIASAAAFTALFALNQEERSRLMYLAEVQLPDSAANLPNGLPVSVDMP